MKQKDTPSQIEIRREQVTTALDELKSRKKIKTRNDFRSDKLFENWKEKYEKKLEELAEELAILDNPSEYNEIPLAVAATELALTMSELAKLKDEDLITASFVGEYRVGARITRDELARIIDADPQELLRIANQPLEEIFEIGIRELHSGNLEAAEYARNRLAGVYVGDAYRYEMILSLAIRLAKGELHNLIDNHELKYYKGAELAAILSDLRRVIQPIKPGDHLSAVVYEQVLAVADGKNPKPFSDFFNRNEKEPFERMEENQRHAAFVAAVVIETLEKYKFDKSIKSSRSYLSREREDELQRAIRDAIYTAFEAEQTYSESPSSKLFVDRFVRLFPKALVPAETTELLPKATPSKPLDKNTDAVE